MRKGDGSQKDRMMKGKEAESSRYSGEETSGGNVRRSSQSQDTDESGGEIHNGRLI